MTDKDIEALDRLVPFIIELTKLLKKREDVREEAQQLLVNQSCD